MLGAVFMEGQGVLKGTFHIRGRFPGRSGCIEGDLPCQKLFSRKVLRFSGGPSMLGAVFMEGHAFFKGTFHAGDRFHGRSRGGERVSDLTLWFFSKTRINLGRF